MKKRCICLLLCVGLLFGCFTITASAFSDSDIHLINNIVSRYKDWHFDLRNEPDRAMTIEEYITLSRSFSYWAGSTESKSPTDRNGHAPSAWCAGYLQYAVDYQLVDPSKIAWDEPVTLAFAAEFLARSRGKYHYDFNNYYTFTGIDALGTEERMYLNVAVDCGLLIYHEGMDVSRTIARKELLSYLPPTFNIEPVSRRQPGVERLRVSHMYYDNFCWDFDLGDEYNRELEKMADSINIITFRCCYVTGVNQTSDERFLHCEVENLPAAQQNGVPDPKLAALEFCKNHGITTLLGVCNTYLSDYPMDVVFTAISTEENRKILVDEIINAATKFEFSGVNLGIEDLFKATAQQRADYTAFARLLSQELHSRGMILLTTLGAYTDAKLEDASLYDYPALGALSDYCHIICYDDHSARYFNETGEYGTLSSHVRVDRVMKYVTMRIPKDKLLLGIGTYAVDDNLTDQFGRVINYSTAMELYHTYAASFTSDGTQDGDHFLYTSDGKNHIVYLENRRSYTDRLDYAKSYGLCGVSVFHVGANCPIAMELIQEQLAYAPHGVVPKFSDIPRGAWYGGYVYDLVEKGIVNGKGASLFAPNGSVTRAEFTKMLAVASGEDLSNYTGNGQFTDTVNHWAKAYINWAYNHGIVNGKSATLFAPNDKITRQELAVMLYRYASDQGIVLERINAPVRFSDSAAIASWAKEAIEIMPCWGIINGIANGDDTVRFSPLSTAKRSEASKMVSCFLAAVKAA